MLIHVPVAIGKLTSSGLTSSARPLNLEAFGPKPLHDLLGGRDVANRSHARAGPQRHFLDLPRVARAWGIAGVAPDLRAAVRGSDDVTFSGTLAGCRAAGGLPRPHRAIPQRAMRCPHPAILVADRIDAVRGFCARERGFVGLVREGLGRGDEARAEKHPGRADE